jgi:asparagine synthetase B (glutamine-hydrolysing)
MIEYLPLARKPLEEFYFYTQNSCLPQTIIGKTLFRYYFGKGELPAPEVKGAAGSCPPPQLPEGNQNLLNQVLRTGLLNGSPNSMAKAEKTHMAYGVEFRSPFTDIDLMNYSFSLSGNLKMKGFKEKYILRKALLPFLPDEIAHRPKFPQRMDYDLELSDTMDDLAESFLNQKTIQMRGFFNYRDIERLRQRDKGKPYGSTQGMRLWTAILTELWAQIFLDQRGTPFS